MPSRRTTRPPFCAPPALPLLPLPRPLVLVLLLGAVLLLRALLPPSPAPPCTRSSFTTGTPSGRLLLPTLPLLLLLLLLLLSPRRLP